jgi:hypothetical protein
MAGDQEVRMQTKIKNPYYDKGGIQVLDVIRAKLTPEQYEGYLLGNAIKYRLRANFKGAFDESDVFKLEDLQDVLKNAKKLKNKD